ncbi:class I SAM-dependent methyltransferase [Mycolicibacterium fortuitum]|jgi:methyltransferase (TIGR00027 family)|uniref:S-adenosyl-L-methionine-dependent methyltransferase n=1 Tax=Mycolicibacterium fortuitum subsp. fortuitum DSM 46621 = ATCC 6841 = JCM 6387 TaxID=1214102 RepID=K0VHK8_MYCFO|nr:class I SAM-dependent methyltransferase [Mycolicibacterium fortuitum]AIY45423.1 O-Methyltransferase involved in polyketide biosynthesis [Mycobacterium sp. VKM Ac-1817D]CRL75586.1 methyltransferase [Mycolicibacter nonchromogenicus]AMD54243.1 SAM-dependent methyltransferase [Mycolicibacterium fortuitum subsp. fortuitum DSM 46621 = ATCC 6841 = JCM 6387]EJZ14373.1 methyltransferase [Mycolicibacterium fortuitum subsp. fortuitum DSM 46621 = ATCC 6841 = JCM 6387]MDG5774268.1 class I SAM-dependent 
MIRTEGDTWDLATSVGATATGVAASRALATKQPDPLINDPYADALVRAVGLEHSIRVADGEVCVEGDLMLDRRRMCEQIAVRTRFFDDFFLAAAAAGIRQAVILASGLDTRAYRLAWPAGTVVFEVDQPAVLEFKTHTLAGLGAEPAAELHSVPIDLRDDWPKALRDNGFDPALPTAWIAEGLLIYLPPDAQDRLFDNITALSAPGSRLATEHMDAASLTEKWSELMSQWSKKIGSDVDLMDLFYSGERTAARDDLTGHGWDVSVQPTRAAYEAHGFPYPEELADLAGDSGYLSATLKAQN